MRPLSPEHPGTRAFGIAVLLAIIGFTGYVTKAAVDGLAGDDHTTLARIAISVAWIVPFAATLAYQYRLAAAGRLILHDPAERAEASARLDRYREPAGVVGAAAVGVALLALPDVGQAIVAGVIGGILVACAPVLIWAAVANPVGGQRD